MFKDCSKTCIREVDRALPENVFKQLPTTSLKFHPKTRKLTVNHPGCFQKFSRCFEDQIARPYRKILLCRWVVDEQFLGIRVQLRGGFWEVCEAMFEQCVVNLSDGFSVTNRQNPL